MTPAERVWRFTSFDPLTEKDRMHPREKKRFRDIQLPDELKGWYAVGLRRQQVASRAARPSASASSSRGGVSFENQSDWGKGEFLVMRTTFDVDALDCDSYRLSILARQGFHVYLNGHKIETYGWWKDMPHYRPIVLGAGQIKHLKKGTNVLAAYGNVEYDNKTQRTVRADGSLHRGPEDVGPEVARIQASSPTGTARHLSAPEPQEAREPSVAGGSARRAGSGPA